MITLIHVQRNSLSLAQQKYFFPLFLVGKRLDQALAFFYPHTSLRQRRRWIDEGKVLVNGQPRLARMKVEPGQSLEVFLSEKTRSIQEYPAVRIIAEQGTLFALYKPDRLHSQKGRGCSLEDFLPELIGKKAILLNRLDFLTSGIVLATINKPLRKKYLSAQENGQIKKYYLALVKGRLDHEICCKYSLDCRKKIKTRVLKQEDPSPLRHTRVSPVRFFDEGKTLVAAKILKGRRHQIRAHLAHAGFPLVGDPLYGQQEEGDRLFLHHTVFSWRDFYVSVRPDWPECYQADDSDILF